MAIINANKNSSLYFYCQKFLQSNYIILCDNDRAYYISSKAYLKKVVKRDNIGLDTKILAWDSENKRYDLYKLEYCI